MRSTTQLVAGGAALALAAGLALATGAPAGAASTRAALAGSVPSWATSSAFKTAAAPDDHVGFRIYLPWRGGDAAMKQALAVSTPGSASYGKYLTPAQFRQAYAPTQADVGAVQSWLKSQGFTVDYTPSNNHYVAAEGTIAQASAAFAVTFGVYSYQGQQLRSPMSALTLPTDLAAKVQGVVGLDDSADLITVDRIVSDAPPSAGFRNAQPCSAYWGEKDQATTQGTVPFAPCGYTPAQIQSAYGIDGAIRSGNDGSGVTVAVIDAFASPTIVNDVNTYSQRHGLPTLKAGQFAQVVPPGIYNKKDNKRWEPSGWYGEETLDIEAVHTTAPGAKIVYVGSPNNGRDLDAALNHVVDKRLADIVTNSYGFSTEGLPPGYIKPQLDTMIQGVAEGIGIYFSSGDDSDNNGGTGNRATATPGWPASSPLVTAVGGTSLGIGSSGQYLFETGWTTGRASVDPAKSPWEVGTPTWLYGSGGGTSRLFAQPSYQAGVVPASIATAHGTRARASRAVPDISMLGDPTTGFLVGQTQTWSDGVYYDEYRIGGTSLSSPLFAGVMALAQQKAGKVLGFANPLLYSLKTGVTDVVAPASAMAALRSDFVNGENASGGIRYTYRALNFDDGLTIRTAPGYDDVTGLGSPSGQAFLNAVAAAAK